MSERNDDAPAADPTVATPDSPPEVDDFVWETVLDNEESKPSVDEPEATAEEPTKEQDDPVDFSEVEVETEEVITDAPQSDETEVLSVFDDEDFLGFDENVTVATGEFPTTDIGDTPTRHFSGVSAVEQAGVLSPVQDEVDADFEVTADAGEETTQVLRRSLLNPESTEADSADAAVEELGFTQVAVEGDTSASGATFEDAIAVPAPDIVAEVEAAPTLPSRALPRFLSVVLTLIFMPVAWYLIADAAARLAFAPDNPMVTGNLNFAALAELFAGLLAVAIIALLAAQSSLGFIVVGVAIMALGTPFLFFPEFVRSLDVERLASWNDFGANVASHFLTTGYTGLFFVTGFTMVALGWVIAATRRAGRAEESLRIVVASENPSGMRARWARKATEKAYERR